MEFLIIHKESFFLDFANLSRDLQKRIVRTVLPDLKKQPNVPRGNTIAQLKGFEKLWRYHVGDYRLIYAVYPKEHLVQLLAIGPRKDVYKRFTVAPEEEDFRAYAEALEAALNPDTPAPEKLLPYLEKGKRKDSERTLPVLLTRPQLQAWGIPEDLWSSFESCRTEEDLLNCDAPEEYKLYVMEKIWPTPMEHLAQQPNMVLHGFEDLIRYAEGDVVHFLLYLDEEQRRFTDWALQGPTLLKGGPGSGKSTVALYRVQELVKRNPKSRVLFATYTNALINASRELLKNLLGEQMKAVDIFTLDKIVRDIVYGEMQQYQEIASSREVRNAIEAYKSKFPILKEISPYYLQEEIRWVIEGRGIEQQKDYLAASRPGRKIPLSPQKREAVWHLYQMLKTKLRSEEKITWGDLRLQALKVVRKKRKNFSKWDFVIIDEAQDLTPVALALAVDLCKHPKGVFLTADASQSIYNKGFAWKNVHSSLKVQGRTRVLRRNYRTTRQIAEAAHDMVRDTGVADEEALKQEYVRVGPKPTIFHGDGEDEMFRWLAHSIKMACQELRLPSNAAVVLTRTNDLAKEAAAQLTAHGLLAKYVSGRDLNLQEAGTKVMTIHSAKGLEFPIVAVPYFEEEVFPLLREDVSSAEMREIENQDLRLLYVAWTRAMYRLFVTYRKGKESPFLSLLDISTLWEVA